MAAPRQDGTQPRIGNIDLVAVFGQCEAVIASVKSAIEEHIQDCLGDCRVSHETCVTCIRGMIDRELDKVGLTYEKCGDKIVASVQTALANLAESAAYIGVMPQGYSAKQDQVAVATAAVQFDLTPVGRTILEPPLPDNLPPNLVPVAGPRFSPGTPYEVDLAMCFPAEWSDINIDGWIFTVYGANASILIRPTDTTYGLVTNEKGIWFTPARCSPAGTTGGGNGGATGGGGASGGTNGGGQPPAGGDSTGGDTGQIPGGGQTGGGDTGGTEPPIIPQPGRPNSLSAAQALCEAYYGQGAVAVESSQGCYTCQVPNPAVGGFNVLSLPECGPASQPTIPPDTTPTPQPVTPPEPQPVGPTPNDFYSAMCSPEGIAETAQALAKQATDSDGKADSLLSGLGTFFGTILGGIFSKATGISDLPGATAVSSAFGALSGRGAAGLLREIIGTRSYSADCHSDVLYIVAARRALASVFGGWFGMVPEATQREWDYIINWYCPNRLPATSDMNALLTRAWVTQEQWENVISMNGDCPPWQKLIVDSQQTYPNVSEAIALWQRQHIDVNQLVDLLEKNGVKDSFWQQRFVRLAKYVPGPTDLISFMTRDVFDKQVVKDLGLDDEFTDKVNENTQPFMDANGIDAETLKLYWRAHWQMPSPQQIAEFVHRLRPDDRDPDDPYKDVVFTIKDAEKLLRIADYVPGTIGYYLATSYRPLTRVDARRAYEIGVLDNLGLYRAYLDLGYTKHAANSLVAFTIQESGPKRAKRQGLPAPAEILKWYRQLAVTRGEADGLLQAAGLTDEQSKTYLDTADTSIRSERRAKTLASYKRRYMTGEFDDQQIVDPLASAGLDPTRITDVIAGWKLERDAKHKQPQVGEMCNWYSRGLITIEEYYRRCLNLGYSTVDATRVVTTCVLKDNDRKATEVKAAAAAAQKAEDKRQAEIRRQQKEVKQAIKEAAAAVAAAAPCRPAPKPICPPGANGVASPR